MIEKGDLENYTEEDWLEWICIENQAFEDVLEPEIRKRMRLLARAYGRPVVQVIKHTILKQHNIQIGGSLAVPELTFTDKASIKALYEIMMSDLSARSE